MAFATLGGLKSSPISLEFRGGRAPRRASHGDVSAPCHPPPRAARCSPRLESACLGGHDGGASPRSATGAGGVDEGASDDEGSADAGSAAADGGCAGADVGSASPGSSPALCAAGRIT